MWEKERGGGWGSNAITPAASGWRRIRTATTSEPYVIAGFLAERRIGPVSLFLNAENLTNVRQTRWDPLLRPSRAVDGRWTVDAWAPLDGRVFNGGVRLRF